VASAVGSGIFSPGEAADGTGTVECVVPIFDKIPDDKRLYDEGYCVVPYVSDDTYVCYALSFTGGAALKWYKDNFAKEMSYSELDDKLNNTPTDLLIMPHFAGAATPYMDTGSKGAVLGLTTATTPADLYRGCMEGVVYEMYLNFMALQNSGIRFTKLHATGGGAHSAEWMQMKADVLNLPIIALKTVDAGTVGSAMLTGVAIGLFKDLETAASCMVEETATYEPRQHMHEKYMLLYEKYKDVYQAVRGLMP